MSQNDVKFNNQAFINSYIDEIIEKSNPTYENVFTIDTSTKSFSEQIALLTGKSNNLKLTKLQTYQYNALIPKVRLFRVNEDNSEYEFLFPKDTKFNSINVLNDSIITGNNCGIKSINWILAGTNPVSAEKTIEVKIEFYFDSINSFSGGSYDKMVSFWNSQNPNLLDSHFDNKTSKKTTNYWSLIYHPRIAPDRYDSPLFRIKAIVGWEQIEPNIINELFGDRRGINEELFDSDYVFYLNLVAHQFQFNEDGSIKLTANYIASLENTLSSTKFDLLRGLKDEINKLNNLTLNTLRLLNDKVVTVEDAQPYGGADAGFSQTREGLEYQQDKGYLTYNQIEKRIKFLSYLSSNKGNLKKLTDEVACSGADLDQVFPGLSGIQNFDVTVIDDWIQKYSASQQEIAQAITTATSLTKNLFYSKLIKKLIKKDEDYYRMNTLVLDALSARQWLNWKNGFGDTKPSPTFTITDVENKGSVTKQIDDLNLESDPNSKGLGFFEDTLEEAQEQIRITEEKIDGPKLIHFTTVGYLFDAAFKIIEENLKDANERTEFKKNKIIFSNFASSFNVNGQKKMRSLASIPIDFNFLTKFLNDSLYAKAVTEYSFFTFIKDLTVKVVEPALESRSVPNDLVNRYSNVSISNTILSLGSNDLDKDPLSNFITGISKLIDLSKTSVSDLKKYYLSRTNLSTNNLIPFNYFIIYDKYHKDFNYAGNLLEDEKRGIYHYTIAQDYGLVKSINFKKIDQPFLKESKSVGKNTIYLGQFRDLYNADLKMIGNNIYYPGMMLFIKPSVEFGKVIGSNSNPSFSQISGIGGYYSVIKVTSEITQEGYTTSLDCVFHSNDGLQAQANEECKFSELEKAGLYNPDGEGVSPPSALLIKVLQEQTTEAQKQAQEAAAAEAAQRDITSLERRYERLTEPGKI